MSLRSVTLPVALGAVAVLALGACSGGSTRERTDGGALKLVSSTEPGTGAVDTVTWALPAGEPTTLDPVKVGGQSENTVTANLCEALMRLKPDFTVEPGLASSADWVDDRTFVVKVRPGVGFWDGSPVTAEDVAYSLGRAKDPATGSIYTTGMQRVTGIRVTAPDTVTITFSGPDAQFRNALASMMGAVVQKKYAAANATTLGTPSGGLMCTGPFQLASWRSGAEIVLKASPSYRDGAPKVGTLKFSFISDASTLSSALSAGEVDGAFGVPYAAVSALERSGRGRVVIGPSTASVGIGPVSAEGPAADPRVRAALDLAIDRKAFIRTVLRGYGEPLRTFTPPLTWTGQPGAEVYRAGYDALPESTVDLERAKGLVAEAGAAGARLKLVIAAGDTTLLQTATIAQDAAKKLGITIDIQQLQPTDFYTIFYDPKAREGYDLVATTGYVDVPGALYYAPEFALVQGIFNWSGYDDPEVAKLLTAAVGSTDPDTTAKDFVAAQAVFAPAQLQVSLASVYERTFLRNGLSGVPTSIAYLNSPWAAQLGGTA